MLSMRWLQHVPIVGYINKSEGTIAGSHHTDEWVMIMLYERRRYVESSKYISPRITKI